MGTRSGLAATNKEAYYSEEFTLSGHSDKQINVGLFEKGMEPPFFSVTLTPDTEAISYTQLRLEQEGDYLLVFYFLNYSNVPTVVNIKEEEV